MIATPAETIAKNKAIKVLMATWKKNLDLRQKTLVLVQLNPPSKIKKIRGHFIP